MSTILYYITGHGFGHAVRSSQVIEHLTEEYGHKVVIRTSAPRWLFTRPTHGSITFEHEEVDSGLRQNDSLTTDIAGSLEYFSWWEANLTPNVKAELENIDRIMPDVIVCDIAPTGVEAGLRAGLPVVVVANFLWDWILEGYVDESPMFAPIAKKLTSIYSKAQMILRTGLNGGMSRYENIFDIPLIARKSSGTKKEIRDDLDIAHDKIFALISLGGHGLERFYHDLDRRITVAELFTIGEKADNRQKIKVFGRDAAAHEDLVMASDLVIGKLGYGLCSEIISASRGILYTPRVDFVEYNVLAKETEEYVATIKVSQDTFLKGSLDDIIIKLLEMKPPDKTPELNGAEVAARMIDQQYLRGRK
ncbi:hypothetical protein MNBD_NITROSPINAE02-394 [hydrothermal vent metagenome]|uniref:Glycosyl transferase family 28 C-terminal domain-containing protein n=1 Tax=hydrothermal vent metagenome TaxID=652676 RepID=A0A3B1C172_9ZZZZ